MSSNDCHDHSGKVSDEYTTYCVPDTLYPYPAEVHCYRGETLYLH